MGRLIMSRHIVIGDVHGCLVELKALLDELRYRPDGDRLYFLGDLVDRGPYSVETVRYVRALTERSDTVCLMGNHEEKYVRFHRWEQKRAATNARNPMHFNEEKEAIYADLSQSDHEWLAKRPYYHRGKDFLVVHAGVCPRRHQTIKDLDVPKYRNRLLRLRDVDAGGRMVPLNESRRPGQGHWSESYDGRLGFVVYGHQVYDSVRDHCDTAGIDTGCCFGGELTALVFSNIADRTYHSVHAQATYASYTEDD